MDADQKRFIRFLKRIAGRESTQTDLLLKNNESFQSRRTMSLFSSEGTTDNSPGRKPWDCKPFTTKALEGRQKHRNQGQVIKVFFDSEKFAQENKKSRISNTEKNYLLLVPKLWLGNAIS